MQTTGVFQRSPAVYVALAACRTCEFLGSTMMPPLAVPGLHRRERCPRLKIWAPIRRRRGLPGPGERLSERQKCETYTQTTGARFRCPRRRCHRTVGTRSAWPESPAGTAKGRSQGWCARQMAQSHAGRLKWRTPGDAANPVGALENRPEQAGLGVLQVAAQGVGAEVRDLDHAGQTAAPGWMERERKSAWALEPWAPKDEPLGDSPQTHRKIKFAVRRVSTSSGE